MPAFLFWYCYLRTMLKSHAFRLLPGEDLKNAISAFVSSNDIRAGWISACVGSLTQFNIRFANQSHGTRKSGYYEIIALNGTVSINGVHLHILVSNEEGTVTAGHLLEQNIIYTTAEIVLLEDTDLVFNREKDGTTEFPELHIRIRS